VGDDHVFRVACDRLDRPVEGAVEERGLVDDAELVVHVGGGLVRAEGDPRRLQRRDVAPSVEGLCRVRDHPHLDAAAVGLKDAAGDEVARDGEHADVDGAAGALQEGAEARQVGGGVGVLTVVAPAARRTVEPRLAGQFSVGEEEDFIGGPLRLEWLAAHLTQRMDINRTPRNQELNCSS